MFQAQTPRPIILPVIIPAASPWEASGHAVARHLVLQAARTRGLRAGATMICAGVNAYLQAQNWNRGRPSEVDIQT